MPKEPHVTFANSVLFPISAGVNSSDHLTLGGCDVVDLVSNFGTPLYVFDEETLRHMCKKFRDEFGKRYHRTRVLYGAKAYVNPAIAKIIHEEGLGMDIVSGGELAVAKAVGFPADLIYFHGNNKSYDELHMALKFGIGRIVVDNFHELDTLGKLSASQDIVQDVMIRLSPGIDPHTHEKTTTGVLDSKFGFSIETGDGARAIRQALDTPSLNVVGIHFHLGSPIFELEPYSVAVDTVLTYLTQFKSEGLTLHEFSPGGGFAIGYLRDQIPPPISSYAEVITTVVKSRCAELGFGEPLLAIEPGRATIGRSGVALYTTGAIKNIPSVRKYVSLDGGMADNIRPALYNSKYEAVVANKMSDPPQETVTLAGKYCESGDILVRDAPVPKLEPGDIIALPAAGAYAPSMASNYNMSPKPAIVMVKDGDSHLIRRRESYEDLMRSDVF